MAATRRSECVYLCYHVKEVAIPRQKSHSSEVRLVIQQLLIILLCIVASSNQLFAANKQLSAPDELHAVPTVLRISSAVVRKDDSLYLFGPKLDQYVKIPFHPEAKTRALRFGEYTQSTRITAPKAHYPGDWRGILFFGDKTMLWDAGMLQLVLFFPEKNKIIQEVTVPIDMIKPPRDRQGEPTTIETTKARAHVRNAFKKVFGSRFSGLSQLPKGWIEGKKNSYIMASTMEGYPLTVMGCAEDDPTGCTMERFCYLEGGPPIKAKDVAGVGVSEKEKLLLVGDAGRHSIQVYHWDSCFNVRYVRTLELPKSIMKITSLHIDSDNLLWVTTNKWENQFDSNLYYWDDWQK